LLLNKPGKIRAYERDTSSDEILLLKQRLAEQEGVTSENGIYGHSRFCNTDFDDKLACLNLSGV
jgi:hypothetical protein